MAYVSGRQVKVGDYVCFKSDVEQGGKIVEINGNDLTLHNPTGFEGGYIGGSTHTVENARDCWLEGNSI